MDILILNRIPIGLAVGWGYFPSNEYHEYDQFTFHLLLIDVIFRW